MNEVLFFGPFAVVKAYRTPRWWATTFVKLTMMRGYVRGYSHCCVRIGVYQFHCIPKHGAVVTLNSMTERVMPHSAKINWDGNPDEMRERFDGDAKFQFARSFLWQWNLLPLKDSAMNCVTMTCRMLGLPNIARTPSQLYERLLERT